MEYICNVTIRKETGRKISDHEIRSNEDAA